MKNIFTLICLLLAPLSLNAKPNCYNRGDFAENVKKIVLSKPTLGKMKSLVSPSTKKLFSGSIPGESLEPVDISWLVNVVNAIEVSKKLKYIGIFEFKNKSFNTFCVGFENFEKMPYKDYAFCSKDVNQQHEPRCYSLNDISAIEDKKVFR